jgi:hypothetical protein
MGLKLKISAMIARPPVEATDENMWFGIFPNHMFFYTSWRNLLKDEMVFSEIQLNF